jgi:hypothetical protein
MVDVDGVISLFGFSRESRPPGSFQHVDGIPHYISAEAGEHLLALAELFELVWATGWEERANEYLPHLLGLPRPLPFLSFERSPRPAHAHWKLDAIERHAGHRPLAWVDDAFNEACHAWAGARGPDTLLVQTLPDRGLTATEADLLRGWAQQLPDGRPASG